MKRFFSIKEIQSFYKRGLGFKNKNII